LIEDANAVYNVGLFGTRIFLAELQKQVPQY